MPRGNSPLVKKRQEIRRSNVVQLARIKFQAHGYDGTHLHEICRELEMSPPTLYRMFPTKAHLFIEAMQEIDVEECLEIILGKQLAEDVILRLRMKFAL